MESNVVQLFSEYEGSKSYHQDIEAVLAYVRAITKGDPSRMSTLAADLPIYIWEALDEGR